jgi:hypothetical protein
MPYASAALPVAMRIEDSFPCPFGLLAAAALTHQVFGVGTTRGWLPTTTEKLHSGCEARGPKRFGGRGVVGMWKEGWRENA